MLTCFVFEQIVNGMLNNQWTIWAPDEYQAWQKLQLCHGIDRFKQPLGAFVMLIHRFQ